MLENVDWPSSLHFKFASGATIKAFLLDLRPIKSPWASWRLRICDTGKCNSFQVISDLLNSDNLKVAITQLCHELHV